MGPPAEAGRTPAGVPEEVREAEALLARLGGREEFLAVYQLLDAQLGTIHSRAQSLMQLAGVVITVTGFSGRIIADTSNVAQLFIVSGVALVAGAAGVALVFVTPVRWMSRDLHLPDHQWVVATLRRRNRKSRAVLAASALLVLGITLYMVAIALMLLHPEAAELKRVR